MLVVKRSQVDFFCLESLVQKYFEHGAWKFSFTNKNIEVTAKDVLSPALGEPASSCTGIFQYPQAVVKKIRKRGKCGICPGALGQIMFHISINDTTTI